MSNMPLDQVFLPAWCAVTGKSIRGLAHLSRRARGVLESSGRAIRLAGFTRLGDHLTRRVGGAGLGLFIARRLVEGMGGVISVDAAPEGGAAVTFSLPVYQGARPKRS